jgi:BMFP domain-containing protein YqiC
MRTIPTTALTLALAAVFPAAAQGSADLRKELEALKARITALEDRIRAQQTKEPQWA